MDNTLKAVSVIIPVLNQKIQIKQCLDAILLQDYPKNLVEIIVVDNGSTDGTWELLSNYDIKKAQILSPKSPYICRNMGVQISKNKILVFSDSRTTPISSTWLLSGVQALIQHNKTIIMGYIKQFPLIKYSVSEWCETIDMSRFNLYASKGVSALFTNLFIRKIDFEKIGDFEKIRSGSDAIWIEKALNKSYSIHLEDSSSVYYSFKSNYSLKRKYSRTGKYQFFRQKQKGKDWFVYVFRTILEIRPPSPLFLFSVLKFNNLRHKVSPALFSLIWLNLWKFRFIKTASKLGFTIYPPD